MMRVASFLYHSAADCLAADQSPPAVQRVADQTRTAVPKHVPVRVPPIDHS